MNSRVFCIRHVERDKANTADPQTLTYLGEVQAYTMGLEVRRKYHPDFVTVTSSPQLRAVRTGVTFLAGIYGPEEDLMTDEIKRDPRLDDFSTDTRETVAPGLKIAKRFAETHGIEPEQALFICQYDQVVAARTVKVAELLEVIRGKSGLEGDHLLCLHGAAIDGACIELLTELGLLDFTNNPYGLGSHGGMFDKAEGFVATYSEDGQLAKIEVIRQPTTLKAMAFILGPL